MRILITRPRIDAEAFADRLHAEGHSTILEPLIDIAFRDGDDLDLDQVQALLFTSANGARAAARRTRARDIPVLAVGAATAGEAAALGFKTVKESAGDGVEGLAAHVRAILKAEAGVLLHPTGTATAGDLRAILRPFGYSVRTEVIYDAHASDALSGAASAELSAGLIDAATFFSQRTAGIFAALLEEGGLTSACAKMTAYVLSESVAKPLSALKFRGIFVARRPALDAMVEMIGRA